MKKLLLLIPLVILLCFTFGCQKQGEEVAEEVKPEVDIEAIKNIEEEWGAALEAHDIDRIVSFYAENCVDIPPNEPPSIGKEAIRGFLQKHYDQFTMEYNGVTVDVQVSGDLAFTRGTSTEIETPKAGGESLTINSNWVTIYRKQPEGSWKAICNIWNHDHPLPPPPPEKE